uniref:Jacalin-type lectin domain-containing protein n=1 Tax=Leersia perrieri TaxID=77586 RepID=A0A0D9W2K4_9ORYZ
MTDGTPPQCERLPPNEPPRAWTITGERASPSLSSRLTGFAGGRSGGGEAGGEATGHLIGGLMALTLVRVKVGPWGGIGGVAWDEGGHDASGGGYTGIHSISVGSSSCIDSLLFEYDDNGKRVKGTLHGEGKSAVREELDFPSEFLTHVSGYHDEYLRSLQFRTNRNKTFGPYGVKYENHKDCRPFEISMEDAGSIVGFSGRSSRFIDAIGIYIAVWNPEMFYDSMRMKGILAYRTSPLRLQVRAIEQHKKEEEERQQIQKEIHRQKNLLAKLQAQLEQDEQEKQKEGMSLERLKEEREQLARQILELEELVRQKQQERESLQKQIEEQLARIRELQTRRRRADVQMANQKLRILTTQLEDTKDVEERATSYIQKARARMSLQ